MQIGSSMQRCSILLGVTAGALLVAGATTARAQTRGAGEAPEQITVTGTRIRRTDGMAEPVPVTTLTPTELQLFEPGSTVAERLDALPQYQLGFNMEF